MSVRRQGLKLALPKGKLLGPTSRMLGRIGLDFAGYTDSTRSYNFLSERFPSLTAKMFQEKDIPIQVAVGNYDLGICGLDWIEELIARYPASAILKVADLGYGQSSIYAAEAVPAAVMNRMTGLDVSNRQDDCRLVSEYPNLAEAFALSSRFRRFRIFPVWGAAEVYPPESSDVAVVRAAGEADLASRGLAPLQKLLSVSAFLIANSESWECRDLSDVLACFRSAPAPEPDPPLVIPPHANGWSQWRPDTVRLAVPDGHQQEPAVAFLKKASVSLDGYTGGAPTRRPHNDWIDAKVIRPQDMPAQVASGNFDVAITGRDWVADHKARFPASPVRQLIDLGFGGVRIVAAVSHDLGISDVAGLRQAVTGGRLNPLRVCSEYVNVADKYLWDNHLSPYRLTPTWGASEAFLPDDADLLIENTQTGKTLARQRLDVIDTLFESTACVIGSADKAESPVKRRRIAELVEILRKVAPTA